MDPPISFSRRTLLFAVISIVAVTAAGYTLWWYRLAAAVRQGVDQWAVAQTSMGWQVALGDITIGGFPFELHLALPGPTIADPWGDRWEGPPVIVRLSPLRPGRVHLAAPGRHGITPSGRPSIVLSAGAAAADLAIDGDGLATLDLQLANVTLGSTSVERLESSLRRLAIGAVDHTTPTLAVTVAFDRLLLPTLPLGREVTQARLEARVLGRLALGNAKSSFAAWRDDGGTIEFDRLTVEWPPLAVNGSGTLALDQDLQPILASHCTVRGLLDAIDALTLAGMLRAKDGNIAKLGLGLMGKVTADGVRQWSAPVTVQDRRLSVGPFAILKVPAVQW